MTYATSASWSRPLTATSATLRPSRNTTTRSAMSSTSSSRCEMNTTPAPASATLRTAPNRISTSLACNASVGSSRIRTFLLCVQPSSARAIAMIDRCAGARAPTGTSTSKSSPKRATSSRACARSRRRWCGSEALEARGVGEPEILDRAELGHQTQVLVDDVQLGCIVLAGELDVSAVGRIHTCQDLHQSRFAGSVVTHQSDDLTAGNFQRDVIQRTQTRESP